MRDQRMQENCFNHMKDFVNEYLNSKKLLSQMIKKMTNSSLNKAFNTWKDQRNENHEEEMICLNEKASEEVEESKQQIGELQNDLTSQGDN